MDSVAFKSEPLLREVLDGGASASPKAVRHGPPPRLVAVVALLVGLAMLAYAPERAARPAAPAAPHVGAHVVASSAHSVPPAAEVQPRARPQSSPSQLPVRPLPPPPPVPSGRYARLDADETFDYVVVGAGSTGSIVASRLAAVGHHVLLLEAGGPTQVSLNGTDHLVDAAGAGAHAPLTAFDVPAAWSAIAARPAWRRRYRWPVPADVPIRVARGLGGGGAQNAMISIRGQPADFVGWGAGWQWDNVVGAYLRWEGNYDVEFADANKNPYHNASGPIAVGTARAPDGLSAEFLNTALAAGVPYNGDFNGPERLGAGLYQFIIRGGVRDSPAAAYMGGARRPPSLVVRPYAHATRVRFARADNGGAAPSAIGVEWVEVDAEGAPLTGGAAGAALRCRVAHARREIILSAGAIHTPRLLLLSGVGPAAQLAAHGVALVADSAAVGAQLMDGVYALAQFAVPLPLRAHRRSADADGPADADADDAADAAAEVEATAAAALGLTDRPFWCDPLPFLQSVAQADKASEVSAIGTDGRSVDHTPRRAAEAQTEAASGDDGGDAGVRATTPAAAMWCTEQLSAYLAGDATARASNIWGSPGLSVGLFLSSPWAGRYKDDIQVTMHPYNKFGYNWTDTLSAQASTSAARAAGDDAAGAFGRAAHADRRYAVISLEIANNHPVSVGSVSLRSADPFAPPLIDPPYLKDEADVAPLAWALEEMRRILSFPPLGGRGLVELLPGAEVQSADVLADYVRCGARRNRRADRHTAADQLGGCDRSQLPTNHLAGTCRMGDSDDPKSVVDRQLRVIGVRALRIADASIFPTLPSGNTHATCMMVGERASQFVLATAKRQDMPFAPPTSPPPMTPTATSGAGGKANGSYQRRRTQQPPPPTQRQAQQHPPHSKSAHRAAARAPHWYGSGRAGRPSSPYREAVGVAAADSHY